MARQGAERSVRGSSKKVSKMRTMNPKVPSVASTAETATTVSTYSSSSSGRDIDLPTAVRGLQNKQNLLSQQFAHMVRILSKRLGQYEGNKDGQDQRDDDALNWLNAAADDDDDDRKSASASASLTATRMASQQMEIVRILAKFVLTLNKKIKNSNARIHDLMITLSERKRNMERLEREGSERLEELELLRSRTQNMSRDIEDLFSELESSRSETERLRRELQGKDFQRDEQEKEFRKQLKKEKSRAKIALAEHERQQVMIQGYEQRLTESTAIVEALSVRCQWLENEQQLQRQQQLLTVHSKKEKKTKWREKRKTKRQQDDRDPLEGLSVDVKTGGCTVSSGLTTVKTETHFGAK